jgi:hypothetical protein
MPSAPVIYALIFTFAAAVTAHSWASDSWEHPAPAGLHDCTALDPSLIVAVPPAHRPEAIERLETTEIVELDPTEGRAVLDLYLGPALSAADLIKREIAKLDEQRREQLEHHRGSWTLFAQERLDRLTKTLSDRKTAKLRPFLVRAVVKNELTGGFGARVCGNELDISHASLGQTMVPSTHVPVVVFLESKPTAVYVAAYMAR